MKNHFNQFNLLRLRSNQTIVNTDSTAIDQMRKLVSTYLGMTNSQIKIAKDNGYSLADLLALQGKTLHDFRQYLSRQLEITIQPYTSSMAHIK